MTCLDLGNPHRRRVSLIRDHFWNSEALFNGIFFIIRVFENNVYKWKVNASRKVCKLSVYCCSGVECNDFKGVNEEYCLTCKLLSLFDSWLNLKISMKYIHGAINSLFYMILSLPYPCVEHLRYLNRVLIDSYFTVFYKFRKPGRN